MRAVTIKDGDIEIAEHPDPKPGKKGVLVAVKAAGINGADLLQQRGLYPAPPGSPQDIPGLEFAGEVVATGEGAQRFKQGDRVMAVVGGGGQAELICVHERHLMPVPDALDWPAAGALPEVFITAHDALFTQAGLALGERVLVHGAAGGVGTTAIQMAVAAGATVTATVRNEELREQVAALGSEVIAPDEFAEHGPFDLILELVGAPNMTGNIKALATKGRICVIGIGAGQRAEFSLAALMSKRGRIYGSTLRSRPFEEKAVASRLLERQVLPLVEANRITVPISGQFTLDEAATAYETFAAGGKFGKLVLILE